MTANTDRRGTVEGNTFTRALDILVWAITMICRLIQSARSSSGRPFRPTARSKKLALVRGQPELVPTTRETANASTSVVASEISADRRERARR